MLLLPGSLVTEIGPFSFLFLFHLYKRKHTTANKKPKIKDPIVEPTIINVICDECDICGDDGSVDVDDDGDDGGVDGDGDDDDDGGGGGGSKIFVHIYSLLLLMSSNKISLSVDWS